MTITAYFRKSFKNSLLSVDQPHQQTSTSILSCGRHAGVGPMFGEYLRSRGAFLILGGWVPVDNSLSLLWRLILFLLHLLCTIDELASQYWKKNTYIKIQKLIKHIHVCKQRHRLFIDDNDRWVYVSRIYLLWIDVQKRKKNGTLLRVPLQTTYVSSRGDSQSVTVTSGARCLRVDNLINTNPKWYEDVRKSRLVEFF